MYSNSVEDEHKKTFMMLYNSNIQEKHG